MCRMSVFDDQKTKKLHARTIKVSFNHKNKTQVHDVIQKSDGNIIGEDNDHLLVKCRTFLKTTQLIRLLKKSNIKARFATKTTIKRYSLLTQ